MVPHYAHILESNTVTATAIQPSTGLAFSMMLLFAFGFPQTGGGRSLVTALFPALLIRISREPAFSYSFLLLDDFMNTPQENKTG